MGTIYFLSGRLSVKGRLMGFLASATLFLLLGLWPLSLATTHAAQQAVVKSIGVYKTPT